MKNTSLIQKCKICKKELGLHDRTIRHEKMWYHVECYKSTIQEKATIEKQSLEKGPIVKATIIELAGETTKVTIMKPILKISAKKIVEPETKLGVISKCELCKKELELHDRTVRYEKKWYHAECYRPTVEEKIPKGREKKELVKDEKKYREISSRPDPVQITICCVIFVFLVSSAFVVLGTLSLIAMAIGSSLLLYHLITAKRRAFMEHKGGRRGPSVFVIFLLATPFVLGTMVAYEGYSLWLSPVRMFLLWAMTITFWSTMLFVPMAIYSKYREQLQPELVIYPKVSVIVPAYNEEKVIGKTIEALIETKYPKKEIIVVDDGSNDKTLEIAKRYADHVKVLHKENGGKSSALNLGIVYSTGEIIVIVDADTIIGRNSIKELLKGFLVHKDVAAVAGNVKVRNRINWLTKCQALEYITGIQIVRRAFDIFGTIAIVPGALGAFKKSLVKDVGTYRKDTIVEDFDITVKLLKSGFVTQGSTRAVSYTEVPSTLIDFVKQRKRWYRGNLQVLMRHSDALTNPRFGGLQRLAFPYLLLGMLVTPIIGFTAIANAIIGVIQGDGIFVLGVFVVFTVVHFLMSALALRIDEDDPKLLAYSGFLVLGFKQLIDFLLLKAIIEQITRRKATWTRAQRVGD